MASRAVSRVVVSCLVLLTLVSGPVAASQAGDGQYPLDGEGELVGEVRLDDETYQIYRYDNTLGYASGIEVFRSGERVTSREKVREALTQYAQLRTLAYNEGTTDELERIVEQSRELNRTAAEALSSLNATISFTGELQSDSETWTSATEAAPGLGDRFDAFFLESKADKLQGQLVTLRSTASELNRSATVSLELIRQQRNGEEINRSRLLQAYLDVIRLEDGLQSGALTDDLAEWSEASQRIASNGRTVSEVGSSIDERFTELASTLSTARERIAEVGSELRERQAALPNVEDSEAPIDGLMQDWERRQSAETKIYVTFAEGGIALFAAALAILRVR